MAGVLDTLETAKELQASGFTAQQAEGLARLWRRDRETDLARLATKDDLALLRAELVAEIEAVKAEMRTELAALRTEMRAALESLEHRLNARITDSQNSMIKWFVPLLLGQAALITALVKLL